MSSPEAERLLLDTHYWIWLQSDTERIAPSTRKVIEAAAAGGSLLLSVISVWEVGMLDEKGRIRLDRPCEQWVDEALATPGLSLAPLTPQIALAASRLPGDFHGDPADRIILATARHLSARITTRDRQILAYARRRHLPVLTG